MALSGRNFRYVGRSTRDNASLYEANVGDERLISDSGRVLQKGTCYTSASVEDFLQQSSQRRGPPQSISREQSPRTVHRQPDYVGIWDHIKSGIKAAQDGLVVGGHLLHDIDHTRPGDLTDPSKLAHNAALLYKIKNVSGLLNKDLHTVEASVKGAFNLLSPRRTESVRRQRPQSGRISSARSSDHAEERVRLSPVNHGPVSAATAFDQHGKRIQWPPRDSSEQSGSYHGKAVYYDHRLSMFVSLDASKKATRVYRSINRQGGLTSKDTRYR